MRVSKVMMGVASMLATSALVVSVGSAWAQTAPQPDCSSVAGNLVVDCGFEQPALGTTPSQFFAGSQHKPFPSTTGPWQAQSMGADGAFRSGGVIIENNAANGGFNPNSGSQSLAFQGVGGVSQIITTKQGHFYGISLAVANSPSACTAAENVASLTWGASAFVGDPNTQTEFFTTVSNPSAPPTNIGWRQVTFGPLKGAPGKQSLLSFFGQPGLGGVSGCGGPVIDDVVVVECTAGQAKKNAC